jgi:integrase
MAMLKRGVAANPRAEVKLLTGENPRNRYLRSEGREKLFKAIGKRQYLLDVVELDLNTGLRKGELLSLKPQALDFYRELIHVSNTKSGRDRYVPMNATAKAILQRRVEEAQAKGYEYIFTNPRTGTRYKDVKRGFCEALDEAGIEDFRFHDLRHTFGSIAVEGGAPLTALRDTPGHTSLETTN